MWFSASVHRLKANLFRLGSPMLSLADITDEMAAQKKASIIERAEEIDCEVVFLDDLDKALVGCHYNSEGNIVPVYDRGLCLEIYAQQFSEDCPDDEDPYEQACEWFSYNTERSLPYLHEKAPIIVDLL